VDAVPAFLLLGVIWAAVLLPPWLQARREARPNASIVNFRRQLWSLARTSPVHSPGYTDAFGAYGPDTDADDDDGTYDEELGDLDELAAGGGAGGGVLVHRRLANRDEPTYRRSGGASLGVTAPPGPVPVPPRSSSAYRRRRRILSALTVLALATVGPAVLLGGAWWIGQGVAGGLLVTYLALLVRRHRRLVERARKVRYLAPIRAPRPPVVVLGSGAAR
jgi:hypothetical protein